MTPLALGCSRTICSQLEAQLEAGPLPGRPDHLVAVDLARQPLGVLGGGDGDHRVGVHVIDVLVRA